MNSIHFMTSICAEIAMTDIMYILVADEVHSMYTVPLYEKVYRIKESLFSA